MEVRLLTTSEELRTYDEWLQMHPRGSLWQSLEWKAFQEALGRECRVYVTREGGHILSSALVMIDRTTFGWSTWDIQRGPLWALSCERRAMSLTETMHVLAQRERAFSMYFSPLSPLKLQATSGELQASNRHEQPEATRIIDLTRTEEEILAQMKPKGRYNIGVAQRHGVRAERSMDVEAFLDILRETSSRDGFTPLPEAHYCHFLQNLAGSFLLLAYDPDSLQGRDKRPRPIAGFLGVMWPASAEAPAGRDGRKAGMYYYGASSYAHRALMAPYLLQWEAMKYCKAQGCLLYDLLGIAPQGGTNHPWSGVSEFKAKFGGRVLYFPPEQQIVLRKWVAWGLHVKRRVWK